MLLRDSSWCKYTVLGEQFAESPVLTLCLNFSDSDKVVLSSFGSQHFKEFGKVANYSHSHFVEIFQKKVERLKQILFSEFSPDNASHFMK